jgi:plastocyanin
VSRIALLLLACGATMAQAADLRAVVRDDAGAPLADAVVVAVPDVAVPRSARSGADQLEQIDLEFVPRVKVIQAGTALSFPNRDKVRHHVYSFSAPKRFDLPLYAGTPAQPVRFDVPGVVTIGCNIHDWMIGYIYVSESPFFAKTDASGAALIGGLAPGRYTVRAWHPRLAAAEEATRRGLELGAAGASLEWRLALKPEIAVRRAPAAGRGARY